MPAETTRALHVTEYDKIATPYDIGTTYKVCYTNGVYMGDFVVHVDGYYYWWPEPTDRGGIIQGWVLRELADRLDELNADWDAHINAYFENNNKEQDDREDNTMEQRRLPSS